MWIRTIHKTDYPAVDRLLLQLQQADVTARPDQFAPMAHYMPQESFENLLKNENVLALLVQERLEVVACCFVSLLDRSSFHPCKTAYIDLLVVDEKHRRQGIGKMLFREVETRARRFGAQRVELMVWSHNTIAEKAYAAYGMTPQRSIYEIAL